MSDDPFAEGRDAYEPRPGLTHRDADWAGLRVLVAGLGVSGFASADALWERGAVVTVVDGKPAGVSQDTDERADILDILGVTVRRGEEHTAGLPAETVDLVVTSPGWRPSQPLLLEAVLDPQGYDVLAVELSSFQLYWQRSVSAVASACLNVAPDHLDWHGSFEEYLRAKGRVYEHTHIACVYNVADPLTEQLVMEAEVVEGCRAIGFTLGVPAPSMLGLVDDVLADRAFVEQRQNSAAELATLRDLQGDAPSIAPHYVANALAAAALARAYGVGPISVRDGLRSFRPDPHRIADVATVGGIRFVNDSKATNPHAATASLRSFEHVVWVAGGLLKGADTQLIDDLVSSVRGRLRGVVLIGADRARIADSLARHAPDVPVVDLDFSETVGMSSPGSGVDAMDVVVARAAELARPGDVVLLAPAAASMDMFANYGARGDAFEAAVRRWAEGR